MCTATCPYHDHFETENGWRVLIRICKKHGKGIIGRFRLGKQKATI
jgi:hypothetical protein